MRKSLCCDAPAATHGARRRVCKMCGRTWMIRPKTRGRKKKRIRSLFGLKILRSLSSLRGLAETKGAGRETFRRRFHGSLVNKFNIQPLTKLIPDKPLVAIIDALWFSREKRKRVTHSCFIILLRPVDENEAYVAVIKFKKGKEGCRLWRQIFNQIPISVRKNIVALISDGCKGIWLLAEDYGWHFQWCQVHVKRKVSELRGFRNLPDKFLRKRIVKLIYEFLETKNETLAKQCLNEIQILFNSPLCPKSIRTRLAAFLTKPHLFRTYRQAPELNLPVSTNSVENINNRIRGLMARTRGFKTIRSIKYWLKIIHVLNPKISCRGYKDTIKKRG